MAACFGVLLLSACCMRVCVQKRRHTDADDRHQREREREREKERERKRERERERAERDLSRF